MAQNIVRNTGIGSSGFTIEMVNTPHRSGPSAVEVAQCFPCGDGFAVAGVILPYHQVTSLSEELGKGIIARHVFRDTVNQLHDADGLAGRFPLAAVQKLRRPILQKKFLHEASSYGSPAYGTPLMVF